MKAGLEKSGRSISGQAGGISGRRRLAPEGGAGGEGFDQEGAGSERIGSGRGGGGGEGEAVAGGEAAVAVDQDQSGQRPAFVRLGGDRGELVLRQSRVMLDQKALLAAFGNGDEAGDGGVAERLEPGELAARIEIGGLDADVDHPITPGGGKRATSRAPKKLSPAAAERPSTAPLTSPARAEA